MLKLVIIWNLYVSSCKTISQDNPKLGEFLKIEDSWQLNRSWIWFSSQFAWTLVTGLSEVSRQIIPSRGKCHFALRVWNPEWTSSAMHNTRCPSPCLLSHLWRAGEECLSSLEHTLPHQSFSSHFSPHSSVQQMDDAKWWHNGDHQRRSPRKTKAN